MAGVKLGCGVVTSLVALTAAIAAVVITAKGGGMALSQFGTGSVVTGVFSFNLPNIIIGAMALKGTIAIALAAKITLAFSCMMLPIIVLISTGSCCLACALRDKGKKLAV